MERLTYTISGPDGSGRGDILLGGHFKPNSSEPLLRVYQARTSRSNISAVHAVDASDTTLWQEVPDGVAAVAVNTTITAPGSFGAEGVKSLTSQGALLPEHFTEAAVPVSVFTSSPPCGLFFASVITRSSGSGGKSPDLKDLAGPVIFDFGQSTVAARLIGSSSLDAGYEITSAIDSPTCFWRFDDGGASDVCNGTYTFTTAGSHSATVTVMNQSGCGTTVEAVPAEVGTL